MTVKEKLQQTTKEAKETSPKEWDEFLLDRCRKAAAKGKDYEIFGIWEYYKGEPIGEKRLFDFAKKHNFVLEKNKYVFEGSTVVISWGEENVE